MCVRANGLDQLGIDEWNLLGCVSNKQVRPDTGFEYFHDKVLGLAVMEPSLVIKDALAELGGLQRKLYAFWNLATRREVGHRIIFPRSSGVLRLRLLPRTGFLAGVLCATGSSMNSRPVQVRGS